MLKKSLFEGTTVLLLICLENDVHRNCLVSPLSRIIFISYLRARTSIEKKLCRSAEPYLESFPKFFLR